MSPPYFTWAHLRVTIAGMNALSEERKGEVYLAAEILLWAPFPVLIVLSYASVPALVSLAWSTLFAAGLFAAMMTYKKLWHELKIVQLWKYSLYIAFFTGVLFYSLYYVGLKGTTPGNASIIVMFEVFTTFLFFRFLRGEVLPRDHIVGGILMVLGALIVLGRGFTGFNMGDLIVLSATLFAPAGNFFQQQARHIGSSETIMFLRSLLSVPFLFALAVMLYPNGLTNIMDAFPFLLAGGVLTLGISKIFWIESIHRISVSKAIALQSASPFLTLIIAWLVLSQSPTVWQLLALVPLIIGTLLLTDQLKLTR